MGVSMIGIALLQVYWIRWSVQLKERQFDDVIIAALKRVAGRLEQFEPHINLRHFELKGLGWNSRQAIFELEDRTKRMKPLRLEDRIDAKTLHALITLELRELDIPKNYNYGVYDNQTQSFIILNGNYVVNIGSNTMATRPDINSKKLFKESSYSVNLFPDFMGAPGALKLSFPTKASWLWKNVWPLLAMTSLLLSLILGCFAYVVYTVFRQKKLSDIKNDFVNNMTHEFKTPIATISLASDSILNPATINEPSKIKRFTDIIKQENQRMLSQVEKVLQMALIDKQDFQLSLKPTHIHEIIKQAVQNIRLQVQQRNGKIDMELGAERDLVSADQTHLANIIYNLLDNANKYSPENPEVRIKTFNLDGHIVIEVADNGIGIPKDYQKLVFEKFYRVPTGNVHDVKGFGLGLSYVKSMITAHNGKIELESEQGVGSTFTVRLPLIK